MNEVKRRTQIGSEPTEDGLYIMPPEAYHAAPGLSQSFLKDFWRNPKKAMYFKDIERKETDALRLGSIFDKLLTEQTNTDTWLQVIPKMGSGTKKWAEEQMRHPGRVLITEPEMEQIVGWMDAIKASSLYQTFVVKSDGEFQVSAFSNGRKGRADYLTQDYIVDFKTTRDSSPKGFQKANADFGYHYQAAYYLRLFREFLPVRDYYVCMIEKTAPYCVDWYTYTLSDLTEADEFMIAAEKKYHDLMKGGVKLLPSYGDGTQIVKLPSYAHWGRFDVEQEF